MGCGSAGAWKSIKALICCGNQELLEVIRTCCCSIFTLFRFYVFFVTLGSVMFANRGSFSKLA